MHACMITRRGLHHERGEPTFIHSIYSGCVAAGFGLGQEAAGQARGNEVAVGDGLRFSQYNTWYIRRYACLGSVSTCRSCWIIFVKNRKEAENLWFAGQQISSKYLLFAGIPGTSTVPGAGTSTVPGARYIYLREKLPHPHAYIWGYASLPAVIRTGIASSACQPTASRTSRINPRIFPSPTSKPAEST